ncbi:Nif3-like dinuclear metal center hexameric protein [Peredibacter starrii]|uniref:Nif3-like dinuclear metal center hexameric protein n=1 Tax=Peredibacter starrii TaxID=28202 RepID=A0AAX4HKD0_9BACT|nr:Nif3-like dinuclear metal center hexameric protein [Peredibacter starrii]WPU63685.1 Nif3-like dinuclear metal center hexameric protein [Peredibacter starrii]
MAQTQLNLVNYFNQLLTPGLFEDYAPNGLQVEGKTTLKRLAFAVSATQDSIQKAIAWGADGLVVHHGIFWKHQGARTITGGWGERVKLCVKNDLNLFGYHLPLDAHPEVGNAAAVANELKLVSQAPFALHKRQPLGIKGEFTTPLSASELKTKLATILNHQVILASPDETKQVKTIGIITGGANNEWIKSLEDGLDAYLTGEISEYNWHDSIEAGIHYYAGGHHATERFGTIALMNRVKKDLPDLEVTFFDSENPA